MLNIHVIVGRVGRKPEQNGKLVSFPVATHRNVKRGDDWETETTWHRVSVVSEKLGQSLLKRLNKGDIVAVTGRLEITHDEDKGKTYVNTLVAIDGSVTIVHSTAKAEKSASKSSSKWDADDDDAGAEAHVSSKPSRSAAVDPAADPLDDDIPF